MKLPLLLLAALPTLSAAEGWMHSSEGKDTIAEIIADAKNG